MVDKKDAVTYHSQTFIDFKFSYDGVDDIYLLEIGLVPKRDGVYCISILGASTLDYRDYIDLGKEENGAQIIPTYELTLFPINRPDENNYELFMKNCLPYYNEYDVSDSISYYLERRGTFTFRVIK